MNRDEDRPRLVDEEAQEWLDRLNTLAHPLTPTSIDRAIHISGIFPDEREKRKALDRKSSFSKSVARLVQAGLVHARVFPIRPTNGRFTKTVSGWTNFFVLPDHSRPPTTPTPTPTGMDRKSPFLHPTFQRVSPIPSIVAKSMSNAFRERGFHNVALRIILHPITGVEDLVRLRYYVITGPDAASTPTDRPNHAESIAVVSDDLRRIWGVGAVETVNIFEASPDSRAPFIISRCEAGGYRALTPDEQAGGPPAFNGTVACHWTPPDGSRILIKDDLTSDAPAGSDPSFDLLIQSHELAERVTPAYLRNPYALTS